MLFELRIYHIKEGKLPNIHTRFSEHTLDLLKKHNIHVCDFFENADGNPTLYYVCAFKNKASRDASWESFREDPQWQKVKGESCKDGPIVDKVESFFMNRVPYITQDWK